MGILDSKFEWKEFLADVIEWFKTDLLPIEVLRAFFLFLADQLYTWISGTFDLKIFLEGMADWAKANLTREQVMKFSGLIEKHLVFSGTFGAVAEQFDGMLLDQIFEKGYEAVFPPTA